jgi:hypothetical protein
MTSSPVRASRFDINLVPLFEPLSHGLPATSQYYSMRLTPRNADRVAAPPASRDLNQSLSFKEHRAACFSRVACFGTKQGVTSYIAER